MLRIYDKVVFFCNIIDIEQNQYYDFEMRKCVRIDDYVVCLLLFQTLIIKLIVTKVVT